MGIGAIVLGVFALVCALAGAVLFWVPFLGTMISFLAPVLALAGTILGGIALSRAKSGAGESEGLAIGGLVTSIVALIPSVLVAVTCGACNVCATGMYLDPGFGAYDGGHASPDAGMLRNSSIPPVYPPQPLPLPVTPPPSLAPTSAAPMPTTMPTTLPGGQPPPSAAPGT